MFPTTDWSALASSGHSDWTASAPDAMEHLFCAYAQPLTSFAMQRGWSTSEVDDVVQGFFAHALERDFLRGVEPRETRFRSYLLAAFSRWMSNDRRNARAQKRGGNAVHLSLDDGVHEVAEEEIDGAAERHFDRAWAWVLVDQAMKRLAAAYAERGQAETFAALRGVLPGGAGVEPYAVVGESLGVPEARVKKAVFHLRRACGEFIRAEVARTVTEPEMVDEELRYLLKLLAEPGA